MTDSRHIACRIWQAGSRISDGFGLWQHEIMFHRDAPLVAEAWWSGLEATGHDPIVMVWYGNMRDARHIADQLQDCVDKCYKRRLALMNPNGRHGDPHNNAGHPTFDAISQAISLAPHHAQELLAELESIVIAGSEIHGPDLYPIWDYLGRWTPEDKDKMEKIWVFIEDYETKYDRNVLPILPQNYTRNGTTICSDEDNN